MQAVHFSAEFIGVIDQQVGLRLLGLMFRNELISCSRGKLRNGNVVVLRHQLKPILYQLQVNLRIFLLFSGRCSNQFGCIGKALFPSLL